MAEGKSSSWFRYARACAVVLVAGWAVYAVVMHFMAWYIARDAGQDHQNLGVLPTPLKDSSVGKLTGFQVARFGFSFQVPWETALVDHAGPSAASLAFTDGAGVLVFDPASAVDGAQLMHGASERDHKLMDRLLGSKALSSNYDLMAAAVREQPSDVHWWASRAHNARAFILLEDKEMELIDVASIHPIAGSAVRGFQFGDPDFAPYVVNLKLFDSSDRQYWILITGMHAHHPVITQSEINGLIASLKTLPDHSSDRFPHNGF